MSTISPSRVGNALSALQSITTQQATTQNRLATGKRVNTAVDNPVNLFTSQALNTRSDQLRGLLDGMLNAVQAIQAASRGVDGIAKLVEAAQSTIRQAQSDAAQNRPVTVGAPGATAAEQAATGKSLREIVLDKKVLDDNGGGPNEATASYAGNLELTNVGVWIYRLRTSTDSYQFTFTPAMTVRDLVNEINKSGIANAFVDEKGQLNTVGAGQELFLAGGYGQSEAAATASAVDSVIPSSNITSATRSNLIDQFNGLRAQIDQLAKDSSFDGINLLGGDQLSVAFNEKTGRNKSTLSIQGTTLSADNLGVLRAAGTQGAGQINFQNDLDLKKGAAALTNALTSLRSLSSSLGSNLSVVQARQDFTKDLISTLQTGADNLVLADTNEEGANLLALNTRAQLSQTALSLASQSDQAVLRLFG